MKLKEFLTLSESNSEKNLLGLTINDKKIDKDTVNHKWKGDFYCSVNKLTSLEHAPSEVGGYFSCSVNKLTSLEHAPSNVGGNFWCSNNKLTSLKGIHKILKKMNGTFFADVNPIKSHVLGLLLISGCKKVELDNKQVQDILNKYLPNTRGNRGLLDCQSELLDANLEDYAEL